MIAEINKILDPLRRRVRLMIGRAVLSAVANDKTGLQRLQVSLLDSEIKDDIERMQNYAFTSVPLPGAEGVMVSVSGNRDHGIVIAMDDARYRIKNLKSGEAAVYTHLDKQPHQHRIILKNDGAIEVLGKDIVIKAQEKFRVEAKYIQLFAHNEYKFCANGQGQIWDTQALHTYQDDDVPGTHSVHNPAAFY